MQAVCAQPQNLAPILQGLGPTWNETAVRNVSVRVKACRNVLARDGATSDCYVKQKYKKINTIRSETVQKTVNPVFALPTINLGAVDPAGYKAFMIKVWDEDFIGDDFIGALKLRPGMFFGGITPGVHDLWLPLDVDRKHLSIPVQGDINVEVTIEEIAPAVAVSQVADAILVAGVPEP